MYLNKIPFQSPIPHNPLISPVVPTPLLLLVFLNLQVNCLPDPLQPVDFTGATNFASVTGAFEPVSCLPDPLQPVDFTGARLHFCYWCFWTCNSPWTYKSPGVMSPWYPRTCWFHRCYQLQIHYWHFWCFWTCKLPIGVWWYIDTVIHTYSL